MARFSVKKNVNVQRVIYKIVAAVIGLWVGSEILQNIFTSNRYNVSGDEVWEGGNALNESVFAQGFEFLGMASGTGLLGTTGILGVIGIVAAAAIILEFVDVNL